MTTSHYPVIFRVLFITLVLTFTLLVSNLASAQEEIAEQNSLLVATSSVVSETDSSEPDVLAQWYRSEQITGNIDVGDFVVGPGRTEIVLKPGESVTKEISVTNRITTGREFLLEIEDISGTTDGSRSVTLSDGERGPYSVQDYISIPDDSFVLDLGERARIPVTITAPLDAEPGGHYGSVLVSTVRSAETQAANTPQSPIIARVGSLFFIRVEGEVETSGETRDVSLINGKWWHEQGPIDLGILYENTGSVHLNPYGEVSITNMFGEQVGFVELEPWFVLPKSLRLREISWDREFLLGRYSATVKINRGYDDIVDELHVSFWVLPWKIVGGIFIILFIILFTVRAFFKTFEFKRKGD
jgi:hypothetical protein